jgi:predicted oxidoreductase (fatty acid repression mutant protein)
MSFLDHIKQRRTIYAVGKNVALTPEQIESVIKEAVNLRPSAFNSQTSRIVTLFGESHLQFWNIVRETLRKIVPEAAFEGTNTKINQMINLYYDLFIHLLIGEYPQILEIERY